VRQEMRKLLFDRTFWPFKRTKAVARLVWRGRGLCLFSFIGGENRWLSLKGLNLSGLGLLMYLEKTKGTREQGSEGARKRGNPSQDREYSLFLDSLIPVLSRSWAVVRRSWWDNAVGAHSGARYEHVFVLRSHVADAGGVFAQGMRAQIFKDAAGGFGRDEKNHLALIRHVHRIETSSSQADCTSGAPGGWPRR